METGIRSGFLSVMLPSYESVLIPTSNVYTIHFPHKIKKLKHFWFYSQTLFSADSSPKNITVIVNSKETTRNWCASVSTKPINESSFNFSFTDNLSRFGLKDKEDRKWSDKRKNWLSQVGCPVRWATSSVGVVRIHLESPIISIHSQQKSINIWNYTPITTHIWASDC